MLGNSGRGVDEYSRGQNRRRRKIQNRAQPPRDIWGEDRLRLRPSQPQPPPRSGVSWWLWIPISLALGLSIPYGVKWGHENDLFSAKNDSDKLTRLLIETDGTLTEASIAAAARIKSGTPLNRIDLEEIRNRLNSLPRIKDATVSKQRPDSLLIRVRDRVAVAWLSCPDHEIRPLRNDGILVDLEGVVFQVETMSNSLSVLPTIEVTGIARPENGSRVQSLSVLRSLQLIQANDILFAGQGMNLIDLRAVSDWGLMCRYPDDLEVIFHMNRIEGGLRDLEEIIKKTREFELPLATVNLVTVKNIPITFHSEISPEKWQNSSATAPEKRVRSNKQIQEKQLRSILRGG